MESFTVPGEVEGDMNTEVDVGDLNEGVEMLVEVTDGVEAAGENGGVMGFRAIAGPFFEGVCAIKFDAEVVADVGDTILRVTEGGIIIFSAGFGVIGNCEVLSSSTLGELALFSRVVSFTILREESAPMYRSMYCLGVTSCFFI